MAEGPHDREAQTAFKKLPDDAKGSFEAAAKALGEGFEPQSKRELYVAKFQMRHKRKTEGWADFGEDLRVLADRAFPQLNTEAKQLLALQQYVSQIDNPQVAFSVKQRHPTTVEQAVTMTLELESFLGPKQRVAQLEEAPVDHVSTKQQDTLLQAMTDILGRLEKLEAQTQGPPLYTSTPRYQGRGRGQQTSGGAQGTKSKSSGPIICHKCHKEGHYARGCAAKKQGPGNARPPA